MGPELLGDDAWGALFSSGPLVENEDIIMKVTTDSPFTVSMQPLDQIGTERPVDALGDIGAIEMP
jgi:hypothetical protein